MMMLLKRLATALVIGTCVACAAPAAYVPITGFSPEANNQLEGFFARTDKATGRKVAVFDGDGTVLGQTPHYLADECMYQYAIANPTSKPSVIEAIKGQSNVSLPYVEGRVRFLAGMRLEDLRAMGDACFKKDYSDKVFEPMRRLIARLAQHGFETWIVTASPEGMYQAFLAREFGIPVTQVVGVKSVIRDGVVTDEIIRPVPQDKGKKEAIETFVQAVPLLVGGNSRGDKEMIEFSSDLHLIVNPDEFVAPDQTESVADYAHRQGWLIVRIKDMPAPTFPAVSSKTYGVKLNRAHQGN